MAINRAKLCTFFLIVLAHFLLTSCFRPSPPSDELLIETFGSNRNDFETLVRMIDKDTNETALYEVDKRYTMYNSDEKGTIDEQRRQEYLALLAKLNMLSIGISTGRERSFVITAYAKGFSPEGGVYKGYEYFPNGFPARRMSSLVQSLEYTPQIYKPGTLLYRKIDENWYLWLIY